MLDNSAFILTDEELASYNKWATNIAKEYCEAEIFEWELSVKFTFSNYGTTVVAHREGSVDRRGDLVIRDDMDDYVS